MNPKEPKTTDHYRQKAISILEMGHRMKYGTDALLRLERDYFVDAIALCGRIDELEEEKDVDKLSLPARLRLLRAREGLSIRQAAKAIPIDRHILSALEGGEKTPVFPTLKKLADFYGIEVDHLVTPELLEQEDKY